MKPTIRRLLVVAGVLAAGAGAGVNYAWRTAPETESGLHLVLNIAGNRLHVYEDGERTVTYKVSVGMREYQTPPGDYTIRQVIWNPWWHPPQSDWARGRKPESPGPNNPMGRVKLNFAPLLYIHGTVDWQALGEPASHGCVRMRNSDLIELTRIVHRHASPNVTEDLLGTLEKSPTMTRTIRLAKTVKFTARYDVATVEDGFLVIYPDHYGLVKKQVRAQAVAALRESGADVRRVDASRLDELVEKSSERRVVVALDELLAGRSVVAGNEEESESNR